MKKKSGTLKRILKSLLKAIIGLFVFSLLIVLVFKWVPVPVTPLMLIRLAEQGIEGKDFKLKKDWEPLDKIAHLPLAVVASEDQRFPHHWGFDFESIEKAFKANKKGKRIKGASTISQQTAKNVFLWQGRNYLRKGLEVYFTALIELIWGKERILEVYLNVIEMGDGIYGAQAASQAYFKKNASNISSQQAALIAAILPNPRKYSAHKPSGYIQGRQQWVLRQMRNIGKLDFEPQEKSQEKPKKRKGK
ncbi:MAG: monofunctional biosynthetic peptidoglycan transglycosylase [Bacteroidetes bacterium]|nr:monofunctional biosynthetic peptidoglycan transglycosylase [Bacteroidota bacterium]HET6245691.1 monofunctional biosynthetic peptidoglycan transglycosylase [Bacteroidia bacterium]